MREYVRTLDEGIELLSIQPAIDCSDAAKRLQDRVLHAVKGAILGLRVLKFRFGLRVLLQPLHQVLHLEDADLSLVHVCEYDIQVALDDILSRHLREPLSVLAVYIIDVLKLRAFQLFTDLVAGIAIDGDLNRAFIVRDVHAFEQGSHCLSKLSLSPPLLVGAIEEREEETNVVARLVLVEGGLPAPERGSEEKLVQLQGVSCRGVLSRSRCLLVELLA
mmetsp:Transcript_4960/g.15768  ORF Transcript_4960/g.15768 Transcript_4960/m.15768 type:complete len:219 (-) Transcript_4960:691-1347(-)